MEVETFKMTATTYEGLEDVLGRELMRMGADDVNTEPCKVTFTGDKYLLYEANYELRTALKIYKEILNFSFESKEEFFEQIKNYRWSKILNIYKSFNLKVSAKSDVLDSTNLDQQIIDIICEYFNLKSHKTPPHNVPNPAVVIEVEITDKTCALLLDSTGDPLSKRGYRVSSGYDALDEVYAAGLVQLSGWKANTNFIDPMCGSGTLLIEAAMFAYNIPAQVCRENFGFFTWRDFDADMWKDIKSDGKIRIKHNGEFAHKILGYDISEQATKAAMQNVKKAILDKYINIFTSSCKDLQLPDGDNTVILDPPAIDIYKKEETKNIFSNISQFIKHNIKNSKIWLHSDYQEFSKAIGVNPQKEHVVILNGKEQHLQLF
ncbi:MAG: hypothetical protein J5826_07105 [Bacteroidales bacterium]|nr:hypothetical protein [Bacteroidales bacterium]